MVKKYNKPKNQLWKYYFIFECILGEKKSKLYTL